MRPRKKGAEIKSSDDANRLLRIVLIAVGLVLAALGVGMAVKRSRTNPLSHFSVGTAPSSCPWFTNVADKCGIDFEHVSGQGFTTQSTLESGARQPLRDGNGSMLYFPEIMSGGVGLLDYDRDGDLDVYFVQGGRVIGPRSAAGGPGNKLYRNVGGGRFEDVTDVAGVGDVGYGMGCTCGDFNNDGWSDIYVTNVGPNVLLRNNGDGTFTDVTASAGVGDPSFGSSAAFVDYDRDGDLDLFVVNYVLWSPESEQMCYTPTDQPDYCGPLNYNAPAPDSLYQNNGDGSFTNVTDSAGISRMFGNGLGVVHGDFDGDGWVDLCVTNDKSANQLWINQRDGTFRDEALERGVAYNGQGLAEAGMGIDAQDIDSDQDLDLFMTHFARETNTLYLNEKGFYEDRTAQLGLSASRPFTGFGTALIDLNNDGLLDIYVANGRVVIGRGEHQKDDPYAEPNQLFEGLSDGTFQEVMPRGGTAQRLIHSSRGAAFGDYDNDGDIDIFIVNRDAHPYILENRIGNENHWIAFRVINRYGRTAIGARVKIAAAGQERVRDVRVAYSYCASNDPRVYFGLGQRTRVQHVVVTWPDGTTEAFGAFSADQIVELREVGKYDE